MIIGKNVGVDYGGESTYGTAAAATTSIGIEASISPSVRKTVLPIFGIGSGSNYSKAVAVALDYDGSIGSNFADPSILRHGIGPLTGNGTNISSDPKILTEAEEFGVSAVAGVQSCTLKVKKNDAASDQMDTYTGCYLLGWTINSGEGVISQLATTFVAQNMVSNTTIDNAYVELTTEPYIGAQSQFYYGDTPDKIANVMNWSVTMTTRVALFRGIDNVDLLISQPVKSYRDYLGTVTIRATNALVATMIADVKAAGSLPTTRELKILHAESASPSDTDRQCLIWLDEVQLTDYNDPVQVSDDVVQITFNYIARQGKDNAPLRWVD